MCRILPGVIALLILGAAQPTFAQTPEELQKENQELKARVKALEAEVATQKAAAQDHKHDGQDDGHDHQDGHGEDHGHKDAAEQPRDWFHTNWKYAGKPTLGLGEIGFIEGLTAPWLHTHRNARGTPWAHPFTIEPPMIHRDLFLFAKQASNGQFLENEWEWHLDWSISRRLGFLLAVPYVGADLDEDEDGVPDSQGTGIGDIEFAPRVVWVESENFFLASNLFFTFPSGNAGRDLGAGEATFAPLFTTWHDLTWHNLDNHWVTAYLNFGPQFGLRSGDTSLIYDACLIYSFRGPKLIKDGVHPANGGGHNHGGHNGNGESRSEYPLGLTSLYLEYNGNAELQNDGQAFNTLLTGVGYIMTPHSEVRFGVKYPVSLPKELDIEYIFAFTWMY